MGRRRRIGKKVLGIFFFLKMCSPSPVKAYHTALDILLSQKTVYFIAAKMTPFPSFFFFPANILLRWDIFY